MVCIRLAVVWDWEAGAGGADADMAGFLGRSVQKLGVGASGIWIRWMGFRIFSRLGLKSAKRIWIGRLGARFWISALALRYSAGWLWVSKFGCID